jgi:hypothetical protein
MIRHSDYLVPVTHQQFERLDTLIERLIELRDILDGETDLEAGHHTGRAVFPSSLAGPVRRQPAPASP